jgi:hypothetical protein
MNVYEIAYRISTDYQEETKAIDCGDHLVEQETSVGR